MARILLGLLIGLQVALASRAPLNETLAAYLALPNASVIRGFLYDLTQQPHLAGTSGNKATADHVATVGNVCVFLKLL
jgi:hypothetical protein